MIFFIILLLFFTLTDILYMKIPNIVMIPALIIGCIFTGNWLWMLSFALIGALLVNRNYWCGGDAKLLALIAVFLGGWASMVGLGAISLIWAYRRVKQTYKQPLPVAPWLALSAFVTIGISRVLAMALKLAP